MYTRRKIIDDFYLLHLFNEFKEVTKKMNLNFNNNLYPPCHNRQPFFGFCINLNFVAWNAWNAN